jgi:ketosteroid isomerase-like protein
VGEAKKVLQQAIERWNATDRDGWAALYTDDVVYEGPGGARISGLANLKEWYFDALLRRTPDAEIPATGKTLDFPFVGVFRVERGKISSIRIYYDQVEVFTQLGLMPRAPST